VALVQAAGGYVGPALCRRLAEAGHDLVVHNPRPGLVEEVADDLPDTFLTAAGWAALVEHATTRFGRLDAVALLPPGGGRGPLRGPFLDASIETLHGMTELLESTFFGLQAVIRGMQQHGDGGQVLVFTSDAGARPEAGWSLYGAARAGQSFLVRAVALEHAAEGICINALGSKNAVFPGFPGSPPDAATDAEVRPGEWAAPLVAETPLGRLGTMEELAAFALVLLDGRSRFQTAQYFSYSGGWSTGGT
jgi:3-oxoacyl-[acyl-carrier protein] reductase